MARKHKQPSRPQDPPVHHAHGHTATLHGVPPFPPQYLPRADDLARLKQTVLGGADKIGVTAVGRAGVQGMGGIGKSVLAAALAHDPEIQQAFLDGIVWLTVGRDADDSKLRSLQIQLADAFADRAQIPPFETTQQGRSFLGRLLADKACLVILDDVWRVDQAEPFLVLAPTGRLLVTTREMEVVRGIGAGEFSLDVLSEDAAMELLAKWSDQPVESLPAETRDVARACGCLPLALAMAGAMVHGRPADRWQAVLHHLHRTDLARIRQQFPDYPYPDLFRALQASVDDLEPDQRARYLDLALFPQDEHIPEAALQTFWAPAGLDAQEVKLLVDLFIDRSLARRDEQNRLVLHDLQHDYVRNQEVRQQADDLPALHRQLLDAYERRCAGDWPNGPDDGYFFQCLLKHLVASDRSSEATDVLFDLEWLQAKLNAADVNGLIADFELVLREYGTPAPADGQTGLCQGRESKQGALCLVQRALGLSAHVLARDKSQLSGQLRGRLLGFDHSAIRSIVQQTASPSVRAGHQVLLPVTPSLTPPGGPLLRTLEAHIGLVTCCVAYAHGRQALSGSVGETQTLKVWNLESGACLHVLEGHEGSVHCCAVYDAGRRALSGSHDTTLKIWDVENGVCLGTLAGHSSTINACVAYDQGHRAVSASGDRTLRIWDLRTGECLQTIEGHLGWISDCAVFEDGRRALSVSLDKTLKVWDLESGRNLLTLRGHTAGVTSCAIYEHGRYVLSGSSDNTLKVWDLQTGECVRTLEGHEDGISSCVVYAEGRRALSGSYDHTLKVWDLQSGLCLQTLRGHGLPVTSCAVYAQGHRALSAGWDQTLRIWDLDNSEILRNLGGHNDRVTCCAVYASGRRALTGSWDHSLKVWNVENGACLQTLEGHGWWVETCAVYADGRRALSGSDDYTLITWDLENATCLQILQGHHDSVTSCAVHPGERLAISGSDDHTLRIWDLERGTCVQAFTGSGSGIHAAARRLVRRITRSTDHFSPGGTITSCAVFADGRRALLGCSDHTLKIWDLDRGVCLKRLEGHGDRITACVLYEQGRRALSSSLDQTLRVWDLQSGKQLQILGEHGGWVTSCAVYKQGRRAISASHDMTLKVWDLRAGACLAAFTGEQGISCCAVSEDGRIVAGELSGRMHFLELIKAKARLRKTTAGGQVKGGAALQSEHSPAGGGTNKRFRIALSFPGDHRQFIEHVADELASQIDRNRVFYDKYYEAELARPNLDLYLQDIYRNQSGLVVAFFCADYERKKWCNVEWRSIRAALMSRENDQSLMAIRLDDAPITGFLELDGYVSVGTRGPREIAHLILQRLALNESIGHP